MTKTEIKVNAKELVKGYKEILVHIAKSEFRPILATLNHVVEDNKLTLQATDSHTLGKLTLDCESNSDVEFAVPRKVIQAISKLKNKELTNEEIILEFTDNKINYIVNGKEFISSMTETNYPDIERILPVVNEDVSITFNIRELKELIKHVKNTGYSRKFKKAVQTNIRYNNEFEFSYEYKDEEGNVYYKKENIDCDVTKGFDSDYDVYIDILQLEKHVNKFLVGNKKITLTFVEKKYMNRQNTSLIQVTYDGMKNYVGVLAPIRPFG